MIRTPLTTDVVADLRTRDHVVLSGYLYAARDATHARIVNDCALGLGTPCELSGEVVYYTGPSPAPPGRPVGSVGPTTAGRLDVYTPQMLALGVKAFIGKGRRSEPVKAALRQAGAVYLAAIGGAGALLSRCVLEAEVIAYPELGAEALMRFRVENFPSVVVNDLFGGDAYDLGDPRDSVEQI